MNYLIENESNWDRERYVNRFPALFTWFPFRGSFQGPDYFFIQRWVNGTENTDIGKFSTAVDYEADIDDTTDPVFQGELWVCHVLLDVSTESFDSFSLELRHGLYDIENLHIFLLFFLSNISDDVSDLNSVILVSVERFKVKLIGQLNIIFHDIQVND